MTIYALPYTLHVLAALLWVGGMFFAWMVLRPVAAGTLQAPERLRLWVAVFQRFFVWVWVAVIVLPVTGMGMLHMHFGGFASAPRYVHVMAGLYLVMLALFLRVRLLNLPQLARHTAAELWSEAAADLAGIRRLVGFNLLTGLVVVAIAAARLHF
ncbi:CopD family protein [Stutzerimonas azotifigens]|uniref:CopD family protein n=1 Tax=Stutzerimonas azotifigens TaxID=291995 RepID=UPI000417DCD4|nr:CopD family protein [Stutzerimonas azotifigens]